MDAFEITVKFNEDEFDEQGRLKADRIFYYFQEVSEADVNYHHVGPSDLMKENQIWVLTKMRVLINGKLKPGIEYICGTFPVRKKNVTFKRDYYIRQAKAATCGPVQITAEDLVAEDILIKGAAQWCILDFDTRRPLRVKMEIYEDIVAEDMITERFPKIRGVEPKLVMTHLVTEDDIDFNDHTNNSRYISLAEEATGENIDEDIYVNFASETRLGEEIKIYSEEQINEEGDAYIYVEGCKGSGDSEIRVFQILFR